MLLVFPSRELEFTSCMRSREMCVCELGLVYGTKDKVRFSMALLLRTFCFSDPREFFETSNSSKLFAEKLLNRRNGLEINFHPRLNVETRWKHLHKSCRGVRGEREARKWGKNEKVGVLAVFGYLLVLFHYSLANRVLSSLWIFIANSFPLARRRIMRGWWSFMYVNWC